MSPTTFQEVASTSLKFGPVTHSIDTLDFSFKRKKKLKLYIYVNLSFLTYRSTNELYNNDFSFLVFSN